MKLATLPIKGIQNLGIYKHIHAYKAEWYLPENKRKFLAALGLAVGLSFAWVSNSQAATNYQELHKELKIMDSVITTVLELSSDQETRQVRGLQTSYLAGQGVVYRINTSRSRHVVSFAQNSLFPVAPPAPPLPAIDELDHVVIADVVESSLIDIDEFEQMVEETIEMRGHEFELANEKLRHARNTTRSLSWKLRDFERESQDLEFELSSADKARKEEIEKRLQVINKQNEIAKQQKQKLEQMAAEISQKNQLKKEQREAQIKQVNQDFLTNFEQGVVDSLCRFGSGFRALPKGEHITFVLDNFYSASRKQNTDKIYVFTVANVKRCVQEKISMSELLSSAITYDF